MISEEIIMTDLKQLTYEAESALADQFRHIDEVAYSNTAKVLDAFKEFRVSDAHFAGTSGYGYDDHGRETLDKIYARVFGTEAAFVRHNIVNGTHALAIGLYALLRPGDTMLSVTGKPYDTLDEVIGISGNPGDGSLRDFGVEYRQCELGKDFTKELSNPKLKVVFIQRSKGYMNRKTLSVSEINDIIEKVRRSCGAYIVVDNCYGEFTETSEPKADLIIGSLIKNPGGGMAETGAYLAGTRRAVELAGYRLTSVGVGLECGATLNTLKSMYKGYFYAPHTVAQAIKTAVFAAYIFENLGYEVEPRYNIRRSDIIQAVRLGSADGLCAFCKGIQSGSPVDAYVTPEPWDMPGYSDKVIMAAGTFTQGASIELSADGPLRPPFTAYFQGGLTYESGKIGVLSAAEEVLKLKK